MDTAGEDEFATFEGICRPGNRGVGTRSMVVLLGVTANVAGFCRALERHAKGWERPANIDAIAAITHTEWGEPAGTALNNLDKIKRVLGGFAVHANVASLLLVDDAGGKHTDELLAFMREQPAAYPLDDVPWQRLDLDLAGSSSSELSAALERGLAALRELLELGSNATPPRQPVSSAELLVALQCGGSDAFSGISANPLLG